MPSERLSLVDIASYMLFIAPSFGVAICALPIDTRWINDHPLFCDPRFVYMNIIMRKIFVFSFVAARTLQPLLLMYNDKILRRKIADIVRQV